MDRLDGNSSKIKSGNWYRCPVCGEFYHYSPFSHTDAMHTCTHLIKWQLVKDNPQYKLDRIAHLERVGRERSLNELEINELDSLYMEMFGHHLSEDQKKLYR